MLRNNGNHKIFYKKYLPKKEAKTVYIKTKKVKKKPSTKNNKVETCLFEHIKMTKNKENINKNRV